VNEIFLMVGLAHITCPTVALSSEVMTLNTPGGKPARSMSCMEGVALRVKTTVSDLLDG
jgi:hypothetical protein